MKQYIGAVAAIIIIFSCFSSCHKQPMQDGTRLASINIIDRNGFSETISGKDRLSKYEHVDFLRPQPYQKVLRVYERDSMGNMRSSITTYHPNGQPKQSLDSLNGRAYGKYYEWYANGSQKLEATVIGGTADLHAGVEKSWLFDGICSAWDEEGHLSAQVLYEKGELSLSTYYHPSGSIWQLSPYHNDLPEGTWQIFLENGQLLQKTEYSQGCKQGPSIRYWDRDLIASLEIFEKNLLCSAEYFDASGNKVSEIKEGSGIRVLFGKEGVAEMQEYREGIQEGEVRIFDKNGKIARLYHIKNEQKHGEEIEYAGLLRKPKLSVSWVEGRIQGIVRTWYDNGNLESQREMSQNKKNGLLTAWYRNGSLMCIEEYDHDELVKGEYFKSGERNPISTIFQGKGTCTLYDGDGNFLQKVDYKEGRPVQV